MLSQQPTSMSTLLSQKWRYRFIRRSVSFFARHNLSKSRLAKLLNAKSKRRYMEEIEIEICPIYKDVQRHRDYK